MNLLDRIDFNLSPRTKKQVLAAAAVVAGGVFLASAATAVAATALIRRSRNLFSLKGKVVFITGGSRGLGLAMAEEFGRRGARIAICARDAEELERARQIIERETGATVMTFVCDVSDRAQVEATIQGVQSHFGTLDVLVNNAGIIAVGPIENQTLDDFEEAMKINFWSQVYSTLAALPSMRERAEARIVNITSIGGKVSVPHLIPYCCSKFAAVAFSEGLRAELAKTGLKVVTIAPGLMRTGSHINADFKGKHSDEFTWFSLSGNNPVTSISVARAARQIVGATVSGRAELIITWQAELLARFHGLAPGLTTHILGLVNRTLPNAGASAEKRKGKESHNLITKSPLTALGEMAARRYNQKPA
ncbi:MAG: SDR family NAD(P)-dependent oxidoreductase [Acidobacteria bacterium]|nr:SDR family NAD(P)-dependent oxidoreductase [Acidobacteriota bacterium]MBV9144764.1 SDR family NAD(P)-dependent oxidoreductase [Acidobacteriota bacterium]